MNERPVSDQPTRRAGAGLWFWIIAIVAVIFLLAYLSRYGWG